MCGQELNKVWPCLVTSLSRSVVGLWVKFVLLQCLRIFFQLIGLEKVGSVHRADLPFTEEEAVSRRLFSLDRLENARLEP